MSITPVVEGIYDVAQRIPATKNGVCHGIGGIGCAAAVCGPQAHGLIVANGIIGHHAGNAIVNKCAEYGMKEQGRQALVRVGGMSGAARLLPVGILGLHFAYEVGRWYNGDIDGTQLLEKCAVHTGAAAGGVALGGAGAWAGAEIGLVAGPFGAAAGALFGGLVGGIAGALGAGAATEASIDKVFGGSGDERADFRTKVRKAYGVLGLPESASFESIRSRYLSLSKKYHPDKGGSAEQFRNVNVAYETLRIHHGAAASNRR